MNYATPDLTQHPPRGPRTRLGGYVILPRCLDKCRATLAGKNGEYHYACPLDQRFFQFTGIDPEVLKVEVAKGSGDAEILVWIQANAPHKRGEWEIAQWSALAEQAVPTDNESREFFSGLVAGVNAAHREDIKGWFDLLDVDDFASFGGKP
ncbi:MAG: DUF5069 domain-containing protein [Verrucomicrobiae bacterium]